MNFTFNGKESNLIMIEDGFVFPSLSKQVTYHDNNHASYRRRKRSTFEPFSFSVPFFARNNQNTMTRDDLNTIINNLFYSKGPQKFKLKNSGWHIIGEFNGPYETPNIINGFTSFEMEFTSSYSHKFYDGEQVVRTSDKRARISTKSQLPTIPLIELTGLSGNDVQISNSKHDGTFKRIRLSGNLPAGLTIDPQNETIYTTSTGTERLDLLRIDSNFEDFTLENLDVVVLTNESDTAAAKLTYKELML